MKIVGLAQHRASARLASGFRINSAADDAAGLAISEKMRGQLRGIDMSARNTQDGISLVQTAEGALASVTNKIIRIRELTIQGANDTNTQFERDQIAREVFELSTEIRETEDRVDFNTMRILNTLEKRGLNYMTLHVGPNFGDTHELNLTLEHILTPYNLTDDDGDTQRVSFLFAMSSMLNHAGLALQGAYGNNSILRTSFNYSGDDSLNDDLLYEVNHGQTGLSQTMWIQTMIENVDFVLSNVSSLRAILGATQNRLEFTKQNLDVSGQNLSAANSRIRDADMAGEMMNLTMANVVQQAAISVLAQSNQQPNVIMQLLR
ncbi:MAG: flagellin [Defluviitaleaceae bacterium]|nr:flagellin [Defluviitaleaceae bacterium]MCL2240406.1 flagellin [Defluviitaleaceae bacterium]